MSTFFVHTEKFKLQVNSQQSIFVVGSTIDVEPSLNALFERLSLAIQKEPDRNPLISIYFLETLSNFNGQIDKNARPIAKLAYKKCKNADQSIIDRMTALSFENSG
ncbi:hypothetical protein M3Y97_00571200 [Aphelenchoides bicaudatus]|nr:hypothetical protein M3Y97_00571200 [Aphelenchoides bicaudatus]